MLDGLGAVKAMVGGKSYRKSQFNRVTKAKRQPGSAFKPFLYLAAIEQGYGPDTVEVDEPVRIGNWQPENYRQNYLGPVTLETALRSRSTPLPQSWSCWWDRSGLPRRRTGLASRRPLGSDASIALGTSEVTLLELTAAFVPFANDGYPVMPYVVTRISTRDGQLLYERHGDGFTQAITDFDLGALNRMMRAVVTEGTGKRAQFGAFDIAGKTGTSQDYRDAWFIGYTADYTAGVWVGNDDNSPTKQGHWRRVARRDLARCHGAGPSRPLGTAAARRNDQPRSGPYHDLAHRRALAGYRGRRAAGDAEAQGVLREAGQPLLRRHGRFASQAPLADPQQGKPLKKSAAPVFGGSAVFRSHADAMHALPVCLEPVLGGRGIGAMRENEAPEPRAVVHVLEMRDFMSGHIVEHMRAA